MFTGIVEGRGRVVEVEPTDGGIRVAVEADFDISDCGLGDSIAVDGCCLTVTTIEGRRFTADATHETLRLTTLGDRTVGSPVNLERPLRVGDRLGGHMVQGHVDGVGSVSAIHPQGDATDYHFRCPDRLLDEIVHKGSITVDGISLTVNSVDSDGGFSVTIIPHTAEVTTLGTRSVGDRVNLETDVVGKYVAALVRRGRLDTTSGSRGGE